MRKISKVFALIFTLCIALGALALSACGTVTYTVNLSCEDTLIYGGLTIQLKKDGAVVAEEKADSGSASFTLESGVYSVYLVEKKGCEGILQKYTYSIMELTEKSPTVKVKIVDKNLLYQGSQTISYQVKVQKPDGTPVPKVNVQLCGGPTYVCNFSVTDENGVAKFDLPAGEYEVHIEQKIDGFTFDNNQYKMDSMGGELTVSLTAA